MATSTWHLWFVEWQKPHFLNIGFPENCDFRHERRTLSLHPSQLHQGVSTCGVRSEGRIRSNQHKIKHNRFNRNESTEIKSKWSNKSRPWTLSQAAYNVLAVRSKCVTLPGRYQYMVIGFKRGFDRIDEFPWLATGSYLANCIHKNRINRNK